MLRLGILGSTRGTSMLPIIRAIQEKKINAEIVIVVSNKKDAVILQRAKDHHLQAEFLDPALSDYDQQLSALLRSNRVDVVILIGYMRILSPNFVNTWRNR